MGIFINALNIWDYPINRIGDLSKGTVSLKKLSETTSGHNPF